MTLDRHPPLPMGLAVITVLKGMIGTGILGLPYVSKEVRLVIAFPGLCAAALIGAFSVWRLIQCKALVAEQPPIHPGAEDHKTFGLGPLAVVGRRAFGCFGVCVAGFGIVASQLGFGISYVVVIVETLSEPTLLGPWLSPMQLRCILCVVLCGLNLLRRLNSLAWLSVAALLIYLYLLFALLYFGAERFANGEGLSLSEAMFPARWANVGAFLGSAIFAQEAVVISQYVYDEMSLEDPRQYLPVLFSSFIMSGTLFTFVGMYGYLAYGDSIKTVFYLNFPGGGLGVNIGEVVLCIVLVFTYPLQMYPVMSFLEAVFLDIQPVANADLERLSSDEAMESDYSAGFNSNASSGSPAAVSPARPLFLAVALLRCLTVVATCIVAASVPDLSCISGYSGSFAMSAIGFFLPPLCHMKLRPGGPTFFEEAGNILLLAVGVVSVVAGVAATTCSAS